MLKGWRRKGGDRCSGYESEEACKRNVCGWNGDKPKGQRCYYDY